MKKIILMLCIIVPALLSAESIFIKDGSIAEGKIIEQDNIGITIKLKNSKIKLYKRNQIIRIIYNTNYKNKVSIILNNGKTLKVHIVSENQTTYTVRKELFTNKEDIIKKIDVNGVMKKDLSFTQKKPGQKKWTERFLAIQFGAGVLANLDPIDRVDTWDAGVSTDFFMQLKVLPFISIDINLHMDIMKVYHTYYDTTELFGPLQIQAGLRLWIGPTFRTIYLRAGLGMTIYKNVDIDKPGIVGSLGGGFSFMLDNGFIFDAGVRFDLYNTNGTELDLFLFPSVYVSVGYVF